tara:strand:- start:58 stop:333 length:276 start_codon:yes stop_codon:yes gene_type:complete
MKFTPEADMQHEITQTVLEFENNDGKLYNEAMRTLSTHYKEAWDAVDAEAFIFVQFYKSELKHKDIEVKLAAATEIVNGAVAEFELGNFWE